MKNFFYFHVRTKIKTRLPFSTNTTASVRAVIVVSGYAMSSPPAQASIIRAGGSSLHRRHLIRLTFHRHSIPQKQKHGTDKWITLYENPLGAERRHIKRCLKRQTSTECAAKNPHLFVLSASISPITHRIMPSAESTEKTMCVRRADIFSSTDGAYSRVCAPDKWHAHTLPTDD